MTSSTRRAGETVTPEGIGGEEALRVWSEVLAPATISTDHPSSMAFVPGAPTKAAVLFDLVVGASSTIAAGWIDGAGAIWAENQALRWLADLAGFPPEAGGVFVSGGSAGNLSALVAARAARRRSASAGGPPTGWKIAVADSVHSSVATAARVIDVGVVVVPGDERGRLTGDALAATLEGLDADEAASVFAVVASAGATNAGTVDDLAGVARCLRGARTLVPRRRRVRRRRARRTVGPRSLPRHRASRLVHRRSAQVAVRAVRLLRARLPRSHRPPTACSARKPATSTP